MKRKRIALPPSKGPVAWSPKSWGDEFEIILPFGAGGDVEAPFREEGAFAVVEICGMLCQHEHWLCDNYDQIRSRAGAAFASKHPAVLLKINSPGGDFAGSIELSRELRGLAKTSGKKLVAHTDSQASSAGYAIACAADEVVLTDSACLGSIGVWAPMVETTARDQAMGVRWIIVASGARKVDRNPHVPITEDALASTQAQVDAMAELFYELVAEHRGLAVSRVKALEGAEFLGIKALSVGLADRIATYAQVIAGVSTGSNVEAKMGNHADVLGAMRETADGEKDEAKKAAMRKAIKAWEDSESAKAEEPSEEDKKKEEEAKAKAADEEKKKDEEAKAKAAALAANPQASATELALAQRVHALEARDAQRELDTERATLLASRPDFSAEIVATLSKQPIEALREAVKTWPKIPGKARQQALAAAASVTGTRGEEQRGSPSEASDLPPNEVDFIDQKMGIKGASRATRVSDRSLELGPMTHEQAAKRAAELGKELGREEV